MVLGEGVNSRRVYGRWPGLEDLNNDDLRVTTDNWQLLSIGLGNGGNLATIFPGYSSETRYLGLFS